MHGDALRAVVDSLDADDRARLFAIVATSGTTNAGVVDDLAGVPATSAPSMGVWMHVDGAYGGAGLAAPSVRDRYAGVERADSFIVDPHKWLFAPFDSCALIYRDPSVARAAHTQHAEYLDVLQDDAAVRDVAEGDIATHARGAARPRLEPIRPRPPPVTARPRAAAVVQPGGARHRRLHASRSSRRSKSPAPRRRRSRRHHTPS